MAANPIARTTQTVTVYNSESRQWEKLTVTANLYVDFDKIAGLLAQKAASTKSGRATCLQGGVVLKITSRSATTNGETK